MFFSRSLSAVLFFALLSAGLFVCGFPEQGWAQDADADGIPDAKETGIGGNPQRKDVFVECDYMQIDLNRDGDGSDRGEHSHRMSNTAVQQLIQIFAGAPVTNPGRGCQGGPKNGRACSSNTNCDNFPCTFTGITLHLEQNQALPDQRFLDFTNRKGGRNFFDIKATNFNFARAPYYHYCILAHNASEELGSASGLAEVCGNDFYTALAAWPSETGLPVGKVNDQIGTFLHELGHNFCLDHGGGSPLPVDARIENYKPNYLSVMNYSFQVLGIRRTGVPNPRFDFSRSQLPTLNENVLNEAVGIQDGLDRTRFFCPNFAVKSGVGSGAIDWNCSNAVRANVVANPNGDRTFLAVPFRDPLQGYNDWINLLLNFTKSPLYDAGAGTGFGQHQRNLWPYKPVTITAGHGIDREPEVTLPGGRCQEFLTISQTPTSQGTTFQTVLYPKSDENHNGIGDACEQ